MPPKPPAHHRAGLELVLTSSIASGTAQHPALHMLGSGGSVRMTHPPRHHTPLLGGLLCNTPLSLHLAVTQGLQLEQGRLRALGHSWAAPQEGPQCQPAPLLLGPPPPPWLPYLPSSSHPWGGRGCTQQQEAGRCRPPCSPLDRCRHNPCLQHLAPLHRQRQLLANQPHSTLQPKPSRQ
jgi:hypothetical protein